MTSPRQHPWHHNTRQYTLLEYASLKQRCPEGVYISLKPGDPPHWSGVLFVRKGPYAPAILRFNITFPPDYPYLPPTITFVTDVFHPLVTPLTTYIYTTGSLSSDTVSATDDERLPPGGFSLRHGFPHWFGRTQKSNLSSETSSRNVSGSHDDAHLHASNADKILAADGLSSDASPVEAPIQSSPLGAKAQVPRRLGQRSRPTTITEVLQYVKRTFDEETALNTLPFEAAGNSGAWKAWRAHRSANDPNIYPSSGLDVQQPDDWKWDGVWEDRVRNGIDVSISESVLYGGTGGGEDDLIRFVDLEDDLIEGVKAKVVGSLSTT